jgi:hypothetical protein
MCAPTEIHPCLIYNGIPRGLGPRLEGHLIAQRGRCIDISINSGERGGLWLGIISGRNAAEFE